MLHVHGVRAQELSSRTVGIGLERLVAVPVDVGKPTAKAMVCDFTGRRLCAPFEFRQDRAGLAELITRVERVLPAENGVGAGRGGGVRWTSPLVPDTSDERMSAWDSKTPAVSRPCGSTPDRS